MKRIVLVLALLFVAPLFAQAPTFFYVATSVDANGLESVFSNQVTATLGQGQKNVVLTWTAPTGTIAGYNLYRAKVSGGPYVRINTALITGVTVTDTFLAPAAPILAAPTVN